LSPLARGWRTDPSECATQNLGKSSGVAQLIGGLSKLAESLNQ